MQTVRVYNMTSRNTSVRGLGTVLAGSKREGVIQQITFDENFDAYLTKAPACGIVILDTAGLYATLTESPARYLLNYLAVTGITALSATNRAMVVTNAGATYAITLPAANSLPAGTILYFFYDSASNDTTIARAGADTINGGTAALALDSTAPNKVRRLQTNGVSAWITV